VADSATIIDPADYHRAVETLKELLAFWLMVSRDAPDRGMEHSFVHDAIAVLRMAEQPLFQFSVPKLVEGVLLYNHSILLAENS
jgi:hypothetical protein